MPRLANTQAAEDALSETFRTAIERFDQFEDLGQGIYPWLARIAANKAMDLHRASSMTTRKLGEFFIATAALSTPVEGAEELMQLRVEAGYTRMLILKTLEELTPRYRSAIELRFFRGESREVCADAMGLKVGTFDVVLLRALRAFKRSFAQVILDGGRTP